MAGPGKVIDLERLAAIVEREREGFRTARPFPHLVVDDFLEEGAARALIDDFGAADASGWIHWHHVNERKRGLSDRARMGPAAGAVVDALQTPSVLEILERLTGLPGLLADPELDGGGLHEMLPGGFLNVHVDYSAHARQRTWLRVVNLLVFLNPAWRPEDRGWLEFWDAEVSRCVQRIEPRFNRCVVFHTSATSFHGVPEGVTCPPGESRKSVALYYFQDRGRALLVRPTRYVPRPDDGVGRRVLIRAERAALYAYGLLKRYTPIGDAIASRLLKRL